MDRSGIDSAELREDDQVESRTAPGAFIAPMSHLDLTFMGSMEECLSRGAKVLTQALELLDRQPAFRFFLEYVIFLEAYRTMHPVEAGRVDTYIREGRIELGCEWSGIFSVLEDEEDVVRNILYAKRYARELYGVEQETLQLTDLPGTFPQIAQVCAAAEIDHLIVTRCAPPDSLFWYVSPGGARVLVWSADGYNEAGRYGAHLAPDVMRSRGLVDRLRSESDGVPPLFYYGSDLYLPAPGLADAVQSLNDEDASCHIELTTPTAYFRHLEDRGLLKDIPTLKGEMPSVWLYSEPVHANITRWDSLATRALDAAERLSCLAWLSTGYPYPSDELQALWKQLLVARDHNFGGRGAGAGQPRKLAMRRSIRSSSELLAAGAMRAMAERVQSDAESIPIVVFNVLNWARSDVVHTHVSLYPAADPTERDIVGRHGDICLYDSQGREVPFQISADRRDTLGEFDLSFVAHDVPGLGYTTYTLRPVQRVGESGTGDTLDSVLSPREERWFDSASTTTRIDSGPVTVAVDTTTGEIGIDHRRTSDSEALCLVKRLRLQGREELAEVRQRPPLGLSADAPTTERVVQAELCDEGAVDVVESGPALARVAVRQRVLSVPCELRVSVYRDLPFVDMEAVVDWDMRRFGRIELTFQLGIRDPEVTYGLPFGAGTFNTSDLVPGGGPCRGDEGRRESWESTREISRWIDASNELGGVTVGTDHRWTRMEPSPSGDLDDEGGVQLSACLVRGGRMRAADPIADGQDPHVRLLFRFRLQPHSGSLREAEPARIGWEAVQPLVSYTVNDTASEKDAAPHRSLATVAKVSGDGEPLLTCLKRAEDGDGVVARWYEAAGEPCQVRVEIPGGSDAYRRVNLLERGSENASTAGAPTVTVAPWEIVTVRRPDKVEGRLLPERTE